MREEWSGRAGAREVRSDDPDLHKEVQICRRPGAVRSGRTVSVNVNYFEVSVENAPREIFKYHVTVERSRDIVADARYGAADAEQKTEDAATNSAPRHEPRPERPLPRSLVGTVINATLHQYREAFESARVAHDAMASLYSPVKLSWNSKEFADVDPDNTDAARDSRLQVASSQDGNTGARVNKFQTFMVKMKLVEVISMTTLKNYYSNPIVNVLPVLQALDVVARNLATQRFVTVGSELYNMKDKLCVLNGGKEICGGYHQALHAADHRVVMNINQTVGVFYAPGSLMLLVLAVLRVRSVNDIGVLSEKQLKSLARTLRKIEVFPTHRTDRRRPICGRVLSQAEYPTIPMVNVGSKRQGKETWLPFENLRNSIEKLPQMLHELFLAYCKSTERRPEHVLYYRDGVSDGEMQNVLQTEMRALRMAFKMISDGYKPLVTFIVANKRHHTRAFLDNPRDGDSKGNVKPGTVIDSVVVDPHRFDFYLWGHSTLQGTSRPCHYTVLYDDNKLSAKDVQQLTYHLGYTFSRSTHSVSVVTPVYYANEAAAHARHFLQERTADTETTVSSGGGGGVKFAHVHEAVLDRMFFI
ncbi:hypothetical protein PI124_g22659 [Phytophthora idaei]|nr:hypothetical protein PI124_g22659 [Phytophthora idaei]